MFGPLTRATDQKEEGRGLSAFVLYPFRGKSWNGRLGSNMLRRASELDSSGTLATAALLSALCYHVAPVASRAASF